MRWYIKPPFDGIFTVQYLHQKLLESDNYCWNYRWWLGGILFLKDSVDINWVVLYIALLHNNCAFLSTAFVVMNLGWIFWFRICSA